MNYKSFECYDTPYGIYKIGITGVNYKKAKPVDTTPIDPGSPVNVGGFDILHDDDFIIKCETLDEARDCLKNIVLRVHRFKIVEEPKIINWG